MGGDQEQVLRIHADYRAAGLAPADVAMLDFAQKVLVASHTIEEEDIQALREHGFTDEEILDITLIAAQRAFITRVANALGVPIEPRNQHLDEEFLKVLKVGKPW